MEDPREDAFAEGDFPEDYGVHNDMAVDVTAFRATPQFEESLDMPVSGSIVNNLLAAADHNDARADALPQYLQ